MPNQGRPAFAHHDNVKILFDFLWQYQQLRNFDTVIQKISETSFSTQDSADSTKRLALMDVVAAVKGYKLVLLLWYNVKMLHKDRSQAWLDSFRKMLETFTC